MTVSWDRWTIPPAVAGQLCVQHNDNNTHNDWLSHMLAVSARLPCHTCVVSQRSTGIVLSSWLLSHQGCSAHFAAVFTPQWASSIWGLWFGNPLSCPAVHHYIMTQSNTQLLCSHQSVHKGVCDICCTSKVILRLARRNNSPSNVVSPLDTFIHKEPYSNIQ